MNAKNSYGIRNCGPRQYITKKGIQAALDIGQVADLLNKMEAELDALRPSPPPEPVKWARGAYWHEYDNHWCFSPALYRSKEEFIKDMEVDATEEHYRIMLQKGKFIWPARFDQDGFLIVPKEME